MIRLIALDLDGTLLGADMRVSAEDTEAVIAARDRGIHVVLNTARWYGVAQYTSRRLELTTPIICMSGAHVQEPDDGHELLHLKIPTDVAREIAAVCDEAGYETYTTVDGVTYMRTPRADIDPARLPKDMRLAKEHAEHVTSPTTGFVVFGEEAVKTLLSSFRERYAETLAFPVGIGEQKMYVTITAGPADKGTALRLVCEYLEVPLEDAMAVGDAEPDLDMFAVAATGVAMGNAVDSVKEQANAVAPSNTEAGVAWAIRKFALGDG